MKLIVEEKLLKNHAQRDEFRFGTQNEYILNACKCLNNTHYKTQYISALNKQKISNIDIDIKI